MPDSFTEHPSDDLLEWYSLGRLSESDLAYVEEHLLVCERCRELLSEIDAFVAAARAAVQKLREQPLDITHHTGNGPVRLRAERTAEGDWQATLSAPEPGASARFATVAEANEYLLETFGLLYPEHECNKRCR